MIKTLSNIFKQDKEKFVIPRSVQQVIPIETIWSDGIFKIGRNKFARTYKFTDINYAVASKVDKETMFLEYMDLLNSFDCGGTTKITINNRRLNKVDFEKAILIPMQEDGLDLYRKEYNNMFLDNQAIVQVAASQEGKGGTTYWRWYGFGGRVEWCACFVSWCADQSGYIQSGVIPKFSLCSDGVKWFESKGRFRDGSYTPVAGDIIFFDWGNNGTIDHVGIVESVSGGTVNTIEGNSGDKVARRSYRIGSSNIYGYGVPAY